MRNHFPTITYPETKRLGDYLVEAGLLTQVQIDVALADQEATGMRFGDILVLRGWIREQTIEYFMKKLILPEREAAKNELLAEPEPKLPSQRSPLAQQKLLFGTFRDGDHWQG
ncbi:MAG TPA: hypothetical protein V6D03_12655 [Candidatus Caenarcaniphilales bacterium]